MRRIALLSGCAGAVVLNVVFTIEGAWRDDYDAAADFISELALGPRGFVQKLNFFVSAALIAVFALALRRTMGPRLVPAAFLTIALGLAGAGACDTDAFPVDGAPSITGTLHLAFALPVFGAMPLACFASYARLRRDDARFARFTLAAGVVVSALLMVFSLDAVARAGRARAPRRDDVDRPRAAGDGGRVLRLDRGALGAPLLARLWLTLRGSAARALCGCASAPLEHVDVQRRHRRRRRRCTARALVGDHDEAAGPYRVVAREKATAVVVGAAAQRRVQARS